MIFPLKMNFLVLSTKAPSGNKNLVVVFIHAACIKAPDTMSHWKEAGLFGQMPEARSEAGNAQGTPYFTRKQESYGRPLGPCQKDPGS